MQLWLDLVSLASSVDADVCDVESIVVVLCCWSLQVKRYIDR
jgi:hypothetical protein